MGLFSDYLEYLRSCSGLNDIDPCMIIGSRFPSREMMRSALEKCPEEPPRQSASREQLLHRLSEIDTMLLGYLLAERTILPLQYSDEIQSALVVGIIKQLLSGLKNSYYAMCELRDDIRTRLGGETEINVKAGTNSEDEIKENLLTLIETSIIIHLQDEAEPCSASEFRKVVCDHAKLIEYFTGERQARLSKLTVSCQLENKYELRRGRCKCSNCGQPLFEDIPYCFNCYERN